MVGSSRRIEFAPTDKHRSPKRSERGRVCSTFGCETVLSIYNASPDCCAHERMTVKTARRL